MLFFCCVVFLHWVMASLLIEDSVIGTFIPAKHCARIFKDQKTPGSMVMIASMSGDIANRVGSPFFLS